MAVAKKTTDKEIKKTIEDILKHLTITAKITVTKDESENYSVAVETEETGLLIGRHGETLNGLQLLLGIILYKKLGHWVHVMLDVGDYRKTREDSIKEMVTRIIAEVEQSGQPVMLPYMTPLERRIVHLMLTDHERVISESQGEGRERRVMIRLK